MKGGNEARKPALRKGAPPFRLSLDGDSIHILAQLHGISEEKIRLDLETTTLIISAIDGDKTYKQRISLPWEARLGRKRFRKGILELTLEKADV